MKIKHLHRCGEGDCSIEGQPIITDTELIEFKHTLGKAIIYTPQGNREIEINDIIFIA